MTWADLHPNQKGMFFIRTEKRAQKITLVETRPPRLDLLRARRARADLSYPHATTVG